MILLSRLKSETVYFYRVLRSAGRGVGLRNNLRCLFVLSYCSNDVTSLFFRKILHLFYAKTSGLLQIDFRINGVVRHFLARRNNTGDFLVAGELLAGIYKSPSYTPSAIYDCGANIGAFSIAAATVFPKTPLVCYEPDSQNLEMLRRNLAINGISAEIRPVGVWKKNTTLYYHPATSSVGGQVKEEASDFPIPVEKLDVRRPDVWIKLDVEGSEYDILPSLMESDILPAYMSIELHSFNTKGAAIVELLKSKGYHLDGYMDPRNMFALFDAALRQRPPVPA